MMTPTTADQDDFFLPDLCNGRSIFIVLLVAELLAIMMVLATNETLFIDWAQLGLTSLFIQWIALTTSGILCQLRPFLKPLSPAIVGLSCFSVLMLDIAVVSWIGNWASHIYEDMSLRTAFNIELIGRNVLIGSIIGGMTMRYFYVVQQLAARKQSELMARLQALQSRIRPHFLFNSMNIIASLIAVDPDTAERVVEDLSDLFRASLNEAGNQVPLQQELDLCQRYIRIEQLRLGDRLQVEWDIPALPSDCFIPLLTLQPLMENAIYHGVQSRTEGGKVKISVEIAEPKIKVKIYNPFTADASDHNQKGNRMALDNIRNRLQTLFGDDAKLTNVVENEIYCAELTLPLHSKKAELL